MYLLFFCSHNFTDVNMHTPYMLPIILLQRSAADVEWTNGTGNIYQVGRGGMVNVLEIVISTQYTLIHKKLMT